MLLFLKKINKCDRGFSMVESLIALTIVSIFAISVVAALSTASRANGVVDRLVTAESLVRSQLEFTKKASFQVAPATYTNISPIPAGYSITTVASSIPGYDNNKQKITATIFHGGQQILLVEDYKINR